MEKQIEEQMKKAFWDLLNEDLNEVPQKFEHLTILINEIKSKLKNLTPNRRDIHKELDDVLDASFLKHLFIEKSIDPQHFFNLIIFIINKLKLYCAPYMDEDIKEWENDIMAKMQNIIVYSEFVPYFLKKTYIYIEQIEKDVQNFKDKQNT